jgi:F-type H+-transporting ATPase subunit b
MATTTAATGTAAPGAHEAPHGGHFPPFQGDTFASQLIWLAITFGILYVLMARVALPRIAGILEKREATIAGDLAEAQSLQAQSEAASEAYEKALGEARSKAQSIAQETRDALATESDAKRKALEAELGTKLAEAEATIGARTAEAMKSVRSIAAETTSAIVERLIGKAPDRAALDAALDQITPG